jgi:glutamate racemase
MEPAVKPAAAATRSGVVGVLATTGTLQSAKFAAHDSTASPPTCGSSPNPAPGLVELIESGDLHSRDAASSCLSPVRPAAARRRLATPSFSAAPTIPFLKPIAASR